MMHRIWRTATRPHHAVIRQFHALNPSNPFRTLFRSLIAAAIAITAHTAPAHAQPAPYHHYRTLDTEHFHVHVARGLEAEGRLAAAAAETAYAQLARELAPPRGSIDLVVSDDADYSNGYATPYPSNRIVVFATPPVESNALRLNNDWLQIVITHELTHIFHLDRVRGVWNVGQSIFGRALILFPNIYGPSWFAEGLAVYYESRLTPGGRLRNAEHRTLARAAALEGAFPRIDQLGRGTPQFPGGERVYAYGSLFVEYLANSHGDSTLRRFIDIQSATVIPFRLNFTSRRAFGESFSNAYRDFTDSVTASAGAVRDPLPGWRELTAHPFYAQEPRWRTDSTLVYSGTNGRETTAAFELALDGSRLRIGRRTGVGPNTILADGALLFSQLDYTAPEEVRSELYVERQGITTQLTHGQRLLTPDARGDGQIVAIQLGVTRASLVLVSARGDIVRVLRNAEEDETWSDPRWSPDGAHIVAVHRPRGGGFRIVIIDVATNRSQVIASSDATLASPSYSPDGRRVLYTSEGSGSADLHLVNIDGTGDVSAGRTLTGIYAPAMSPDGRWIAASTIRADGYHIGVAPVASLVLQPARDSSTPRPSLGSAGADPAPFHAYSAWRSGRPHYWFPLVEAAPARGTRLGFSTSGSDVLDRHIYDLYAAVPTVGMYPTGALVYR